MDRYQCHKIVEAAQIRSFVADPKAPGRTAVFNDGSTMHLTPEFIERHKPTLALRAYIVVYEDGYTSVSPKKAFEEGYTLIDEADPNLNGPDAAA